MFLGDSLPVINKIMQQQSPAIHFLHQEITAFVKKLLLQFMQSQTVQSNAKINFKDTSKYKQLSEVFVGDKANMYVDECDELSTSDIKQFRENC